MWLFIPSNFAPASACLEKASEPHSSILDSSTEPSLTLNGKPLLRANLLRSWKRERSIRRLCGMTLLPSLAESGVEGWIASLPDSRVRTSASPAAGLALTESEAASSSTSWTLPTIAVRGGSLWRTSVPSLLQPPPLWIKLPPPKLLVNPTDLPEAEAAVLMRAFTKRMALYSKEQPPESWENWPTAGGTRNGSLFQRPMWAPVMGGLGGFVSPGDAAWPTPDAAVHGGSNTSPGPAGARPNISLASQQWMTPHSMGTTDHTGKKGSGGEFAKQATQWLTPNVPNVPNGGRSVPEALVQSKGMTPEGEKRTVGLESQSRFWTTPQAHDVTERGSGQVPTSAAGNACLARDARTWGTPQARDYRSPDSPDSPNYQRKLAEGYTIDLNSQAANWPSPRATDGTKGGPNQSGSKGDLMLPSAAAQWPTPAARDVKGANSAEHALVTGGGAEAHGSTSQLRGALPLFAPGPSDPRWAGIIERCPWLAPATEPGIRMPVDGDSLLVDESRNHQLRQVGNGCVPLQAALAFAVLAQRAGIFAAAPERLTA